MQSHTLPTQTPRGATPCTTTPGAVSGAQTPHRPDPASARITHCPVSPDLIVRAPSVGRGHVNLDRPSHSTRARPPVFPSEPKSSLGPGHHPGSLGASGACGSFLTAGWWEIHPPQPQLRVPPCLSAPRPDEPLRATIQCPLHEHLQQINSPRPQEECARSRRWRQLTGSQPAQAAGSAQ